MIKKETIVLIPAWGMGHIIPMTELAKLFTTTTTFAISIVIFDTPYDATTTTDPFISRVTTCHPSISFHRLPKPSPPPDHHIFDVPFSYDLLRFTNPQLTHFLKTLEQTFDIRAVVLDMFCSASLDVACELNIPAYFFCPYSAFAHATFVSLPSIESQMTNSSMSFRDLGKTPLHPLPCLPPIPASYLPAVLLDRGTQIQRALMYHLRRHPKADGILINTFEAFEPRAVKAINDGLYGPMPPIYCIGPLMSSEEEEEEKHECLKWLDEQPKGSVVFLCFGSMGSFSVDQVKAIANGLEQSGHRFLWVLKNALANTTGDKRVAFGKSLDPVLDQLLPEGFLSRTKGRGMVVKLWAPQKAVLGHGAVGAFVSHCGWNSTLEAVTAGVAMIAWPLYAEQRMNKVFLVEEAKVAVEMEGSDEEMVKAEEVERKVRWLMETGEGKEMKQRMRVMKESAVGARMEGGPSDLAWMEFLARFKSSVEI